MVKQYCGKSVSRTGLIRTTSWHPEVTFPRQKNKLPFLLPFTLIFSLNSFVLFHFLNKETFLYVSNKAFYLKATIINKRLKGKQEIVQAALTVWACGYYVRIA